MPRHVVATVDEIPPGERKVVVVDGREVVVFNLAGAFFGILNRCPHQGGKLCHGVLSGLTTASEPGEFNYTRPGEFVRCPWHGWYFDIRNGQSWGEPEGVRTRHYETAVASGSELEKGPYHAETLHVTTDRQYVVIET